MISGSEASGPEQPTGLTCPPTRYAHLSFWMVGRRFLAWLHDSRKGRTESTDSTVLPRPQSQPPTRSSYLISQTLQRRSSDGRSSRLWFSGDLFSQLVLCPTDSTASRIPPVPDHQLPIPNVEESKPVALSSYTVDPTAAYNQNWKSTLYASAGLVVDVLKESSDAFTPLKSVAGGLSAILKYYEV